MKITNLAANLTYTFLVVWGKI